MELWTDQLLRAQLLPFETQYYLPKCGFLKKVVHSLNQQSLIFGALFPEAKIHRLGVKVEREEVLVMI